MTPLETVALYYDAGQKNKATSQGCRSPTSSSSSGQSRAFATPPPYRAMAREAGRAVTSFQVRQQFADGNLVCSIIDWDMAIPGVGAMTSAELLEVVDGVIVRGELIYDGEPLRQAMAQQAS
jgi:hypothetical protein